MDERPNLNSSNRDLLALIIMVLGPLSGLLFLACIAPLDALGRLQMSAALADDLATGKLRPLLSSASKATSRGYRRDSAEEESLSTTLQQYDAEQGRRLLIAAERRARAITSRQAMQVDLLRVVVLLFPRVARFLPQHAAALLARENSDAEDGIALLPLRRLPSTPAQPSLGPGVGICSRAHLSTPPSVLPGQAQGDGSDRSPRPTRRGILGSGVEGADGSACVVPGMDGAGLEGRPGYRDPMLPVLVGLNAVVLNDDDDDEACILGSAARVMVRHALPAAYSLRDWVLRYSTEHHGCSLRTAYSKLAHSTGPTLVMVLDAAGHRFGGFATEPWCPSSRYFGSGESFLFHAHPGAGRVYRWSGSNTHFPLAYHDSIAMGGGGHFGLWLDEAFEYGSSGRSETYCNAPLASDESFRIIRVEIWELCGDRSDPHSPRTPPTPSHVRHTWGAGGALGRAMAAAEVEDGESPCVTARIGRQGSSAFLKSLLGPARF